MNEVMAIIRPDRWRATQSRIEALGLPECIQHRVLGRGRERGLRYLSRQGAAAGTGVQFFPKRMLWWSVEESQVEPLIEAIIDVNRTGGLGDGKIFVLAVEESIPISPEEVEVEELEVQRDSLMAEVSDASR